MSPILLEVCVDDADGFDAAVGGGADRIELCAALALGGLTPSLGFMRHAAACPRPVYAMIRPRAGHFVFGDADAAVMERDIEAVREAGLAGVVLGASRDDGQLDAALLSRLVRQATGLGLTLHRAFDLVPDVAEAVETAIDLGFERILTSGGMTRAVDGAERLRQAVAAARGRIGIMPGSGVTAETFEVLRAIVSFREIHASCSERIPPGEGQALALGFEGSKHRKTSAASVTQLKALCAIE